MLPGPNTTSSQTSLSHLSPRDRDDLVMDFAVLPTSMLCTLRFRHLSEMVACLPSGLFLSRDSVSVCQVPLACFINSARFGASSVQQAKRHHAWMPNPRAWLGSRWLGHLSSWTGVRDAPMGRPCRLWLSIDWKEHGQARTPAEAQLRSSVS